MLANKKNHLIAGYRIDYRFVLGEVLAVIRVNSALKSKFSHFNHLLRYFYIQLIIYLNTCLFSILPWLN